MTKFQEVKKYHFQRKQVPPHSNFFKISRIWNILVPESQPEGDETDVGCLYPLIIPKPLYTYLPTSLPTYLPPYLPTYLPTYIQEKEGQWLN